MTTSKESSFQIAEFAIDHPIFAMFVLGLIALIGSVCIFALPAGWPPIFWKSMAVQKHSIGYLNSKLLRLLPDRQRPINNKTKIERHSFLICRNQISRAAKRLFLFTAGL